MTREDYNRYAEAFNARDYDTVYDFYKDGSELNFFGLSLKSREDFKRFYTFFHSYVIETLTIERFAGGEELVALEGIIRVEGKRDLDRATLDAEGYDQFHPVRAGEVIEMRQYIHYHVDQGQLTHVGCVII